jgi:hypothetical protein
MSVADEVAGEADESGARRESGAESGFEIGRSYAVRDVDVGNVEKTSGLDAWNVDGSG